MNEQVEKNSFFNKVKNIDFGKIKKDIIDNGMWLSIVVGVSILGKFGLISLGIGYIAYSTHKEYYKKD